MVVHCVFAITITHTITHTFHLTARPVKSPTQSARRKQLGFCTHSHLYSANGRCLVTHRRKFISFFSPFFFCRRPQEDGKLYLSNTQTHVHSGGNIWRDKPRRQMYECAKSTEMAQGIQAAGFKRHSEFCVL